MLLDGCEQHCSPHHRCLSLWIDLIFVWPLGLLKNSMHVQLSWLLETWLEFFWLCELELTSVETIWAPTGLLISFVSGVWLQFPSFLSVSLVEKIHVSQQQTSSLNVNQRFGASSSNRLWRGQMKFYFSVNKLSCHVFSTNIVLLLFNVKAKLLLDYLVWW